jgi:transposase
MKKNPATVVLSRFAEAGVSARSIAKALGVHPSTVGRWPERNRGAGDIPSLYHRGLLKLAAERGALVTADTLVTGDW